MVVNSCVQFCSYYFLIFYFILVQIRLLLLSMFSFLHSIFTTCKVEGSILCDTGYRYDYCIAVKLLGNNWTGQNAIILCPKQRTTILFDRLLRETTAVAKAADSASSMTFFKHNCCFPCVQLVPDLYDLRFNEQINLNTILHCLFPSSIFYACYIFWFCLLNFVGHENIGESDRHTVILLHCRDFQMSCFLWTRNIHKLKEIGSEYLMDLCQFLKWIAPIH